LSGRSPDLILAGMTARSHTRRAPRRRDTCQYCDGELLTSVFDTIFRAERSAQLPDEIDPAALESIESLLEATRPRDDDPAGREDYEERLFFAIPGGRCVPCRQLSVDQQLIGILGLADARCTFAIESDRVLRANAA
jgi:hypothetical protein